MATLLRRRDEHDQLNNVSADVEANVNGSSAKQQPIISPDSTLEEPGSKIWGPYLELADKYDKDLVHNWRDDMDSLLIFAALFSASVTAFVIESYKTLVQDSGDVTVDVLLQISRQLANVTQAPIILRPPFQPGSTDIAINVFWFLSLAFSLACALAAVLVRQWARQYLRFPRSFSSTTQQARARQFLFENMQWWKMEVVVEMIPALLHISLILFFIGLLLFAHTISVTLSIYLLCFSMIGGMAYAFITATPLIFPGCPYKTPFSASIGIGVRIGQPPLKTMWTFATVSLECLISLLSSTPSALISLFIPQATIHVWQRAMHISQSTRSQCSRLLSCIRRTDHSLRGIWATTCECGLNLVHFPCKVFEHIASSWVFTLSYLNKASLSVSKAFLAGQQILRNELSMRDARALHWAMEFTKKDVDLFTIITSVPEFVQMHELNGDIGMLMWNSGVVAHTQRLLRSTAISNSGFKSPFIFLKCLEGIIWSTQCATDVLDEDRAWSHVDMTLSAHLTSDLSQLLCKNYVTGAKDKLRRTLECALSNVLLRWSFHLEKSILSMDEEGFQRNYQSHRIEVFVMLCRSKDSLGDDPVSRKFYEIFVGIMTPFYETNLTQKEFCRGLGRYRATLASRFLTSSFQNIQLSSTLDTMFWNSLCDHATHLQPFPISTRDDQEAVFMLAAYGEFRTVQTKQPLLWQKLNSKRAQSLFSNYCQVLFGEAHDINVGLMISPPLRRIFFSRVHVYHREGVPFQNSGKTVEIPFDAYCKILDDLLFSVQMFPGEKPPDESNHEDVLTVAIQKLIRCRLCDVHPSNNVPIIIDARHLTVARAVLTKGHHNHFMLDGVGIPYLVERTAAELGYAFQLEMNYNIDMHAELQYYGPGIFGHQPDFFHRSPRQHSESVTEICEPPWINQ